MCLRIDGETLVMHPERAVLWPARRTLIVADTHFGKSGLLREQGLAVPAGSDEHDRTRLTHLIAQTRALRLIVLGDFLHAPLDAGSPDASALARWLATLGSTEVHVVAGNHDRGVAQRWLPPVQWHHAEMREPPFRFMHDFEQGRPSDVPFTLSGHVHPVAKLGGLRKSGSRVPIFWLRKWGLVLPSFGVFTGGFAVTPAAGDRVFAVGTERVVPFPPTAPRRPVSRTRHTRIS
ncbi:MAG: ligase-associated DNA damage response endonuclease PdeM [Steroidobacteraceae bacterium]